MNTNLEMSSSFHGNGLNAPLLGLQNYQQQNGGDVENNQSGALDYARQRSAQRNEEQPVTSTSFCCLGKKGGMSIDQQKALLNRIIAFYQYGIRQRLADQIAWLYNKYPELEKSEQNQDAVDQREQEIATNTGYWLARYNLDSKELETLKQNVYGIFDAKTMDAEAQKLLTKVSHLCEGKEPSEKETKEIIKEAHRLLGNKEEMKEMLTGLEENFVKNQPGCCGITRKIAPGMRGTLREMWVDKLHKAELQLDPSNNTKPLLEVFKAMEYKYAGCKGLRTLATLCSDFLLQGSTAVATVASGLTALYLDLEDKSQKFNKVWLMPVLTASTGIALTIIKKYVINQPDNSEQLKNISKDLEKMIHYFTLEVDAWLDNHLGSPPEYRSSIQEARTWIQDKSDHYKPENLKGFKPADIPKPHEIKRHWHLHDVANNMIEKMKHNAHNNEHGQQKILNKMGSNKKAILQSAKSHKQSILKNSDLNTKSILQKSTSNTKSILDKMAEKDHVVLSIKDEMEKYQNQIATTMQNKIKILKAECVKLRSELDKTNEEMGPAKVDNRDLTIKLEEKINEIQRLENKIKEHENIIQANKLEIDKKNETIKHMKQQIENKENRYRATEQLLHKVDANRLKAIKEKNALSSKVRELESNSNLSENKVEQINSAQVAQQTNDKMIEKQPQVEINIDQGQSVRGNDAAGQNVERVESQGGRPCR